MAKGIMLKVCVSAMLALACWAAGDDQLPAEHRGGAGGGVSLGPDPVSVPDIETELEAQLRDSLPPGMVVAAPQYQYRPLYTAWSLYPAPQYAPLPTVYSASAGAVVQPVPWYLPAVVRRQQPYQYRIPMEAESQVPSVAASRIYDVTVSSAHAPQLAE